MHMYNASIVCQYKKCKFCLVAGLEKNYGFYEKTEKKPGFFGLNRFLWFKPVFMVFIISPRFLQF